MKYVNENMPNEEEMKEFTQDALDLDYTTYDILKLNLTPKEQAKMLEEYRLIAITNVKENRIANFSEKFIVFDINLETGTGRVLSEHCLEG